MRATEFITELFQPGKKNWEWARLGRDEASAFFKIGNREYLWQAFVGRGNPKKWEIQFRLIRKPDVDPDTLDLFGTTGTGNSAEVMSTAVDITRAFLTKYGLDNIEEITFNAKEDSRIGLYAKMIKRLLPDWDLHSRKHPYNGMVFTLTDRRAYDKPENKITSEMSEDISRRGFLGGLAGMAKARKVKVVRGLGKFLDANHVEVELTSGSGQDLTGQKEVVRFQKAIIAAGSQPVKLPFLPEDPRIVDSTGALLLKSIPKRMLVIGGGIIGLEMATVYSTLGSRIDIAEMLDGLMAGADRDLEKVWEKFNAGRFENIMLKTRAAKAEVKPDGIQVTFEGENAPAQAQTYDLVLVAIGRTPNGKKIAADQAGVQVDERGFIPVDQQMRTNVANIFAIGDLVGQPMLAHKAVHEGHVATEAAAGEKSYFDAKQIPSVAYTDPEVAWAGLTEEQCKAKGIAYEKGLFPWAASGRAIANGRDEGFTKLIFDANTHRIIGGGIVGTHAGDLIGEVCLAIEMGADAVDIGKTIHPHPTLGESVGLAAEAAHGHCTDLPPVKKNTA